jgi:hypothetical protein
LNNCRNMALSSKSRISTFPSAIFLPIYLFNDCLSPTCAFTRAPFATKSSSHNQWKWTSNSCMAEFVTWVERNNN